LVYCIYTNLDNILNEINFDMYNWLYITKNFCIEFFMIFMSKLITLFFSFLNKGFCFFLLVYAIKKLVVMNYCLEDLWSDQDLDTKSEE